MNIENIERVRLLINELQKLEFVVQRYENNALEDKFFLFKYDTFDPIPLYFSSKKLEHKLVEAIKERIIEIQKELEEL